MFFNVQRNSISTTTTTTTTVTLKEENIYYMTTTIAQTHTMIHPERIIKILFDIETNPIHKKHSVKSDSFIIFIASGRESMDIVVCVTFLVSEQAWSGSVFDLQSFFSTSSQPKWQ